MVIVVSFLDALSNGSYWYACNSPISWTFDHQSTTTYTSLLDLGADIGPCLKDNLSSPYSHHRLWNDHLSLGLPLWELPKLCVRLSGQCHPSLPYLSQSHLSWQREVASACENSKLRLASSEAFLVRVSSSSSKNPACFFNKLRTQEFPGINFADTTPVQMKGLKPIPF